MSDAPRVKDHDNGQITVALDGKELRGWEYRNDAERRQKMLMASEYVEGWHDGQDAHRAIVKRFSSVTRKAG